MKKNFFIKTLCAFYCVAAFAACSSDSNDDPPLPPSGSEFTTKYVIGVSSGRESYLLTVDDITKGEISSKGKGKKAFDTTIYPFNDGEKGFLFDYRKGDPAGIQSCSFGADGTLIPGVERVLPTREEFIGYYKDQLVAMTSITLNNGKLGEAFNFIDGKTEVVTTAYMSTEGLVHDGEYANVGGLIVVGDNFLSALEPYRIPTKDNTSDQTAYPDELNMAVLRRNGDKMEKVDILTNKNASHAVGRRRSGRLNSIGQNASGDIYLFSPANQRNDAERGQDPIVVNVTKHPSSVTKINGKTLKFDGSYYYDIEKLSGGLKLQNADPLYGDYFLLNMFAVKDRAWNMQTANKFAIFNVVSGEFKWIEGLPKPEEIGGYAPEPYVEKGVLYLPLSSSESGNYVYIIDAAKGKATKGLKIIENDVSLGSIAKMKVPTKAK